MALINLVKIHWVLISFRVLQDTLTMNGKKITIKVKISKNKNSKNKKSNKNNSNNNKNFNDNNNVDSDDYNKIVLAQVFENLFFTMISKVVVFRFSNHCSIYFKYMAQ